jgi:hypothetical protein
MPLYVASPMKRAEDASCRLADLMSSLKHASGYAGTPATGKLFAFDASAAEWLVFVCRSWWVIDALA